MTKAQSYTRYQQTHAPINVRMVLCANTEPPTEQGRCPACDRSLNRTGRSHKPATIGALGWIKFYADGSTVTTAPGMDF